MENSPEYKRKNTRGRKHWKQKGENYLRKRKIWVLWDYTIYNKIYFLLLKINWKTEMGDNFGDNSVKLFFKLVRQIHGLFSDFKQVTKVCIHVFP